MGKPSAPKPPDPVRQGSAQTATNIGSAVANAFLQNPTQVTPTGTYYYGKTGSMRWNDPVSGKTYNIPQFTATTKLTPQGQRIQDARLDTQENLANFGSDQTDRLNDLLSRPVDMDNEAVEGRLLELGRRRLDPMLDERREARETQLANQGLMPGSEGYDRAMRTTLEAENDAYNQLLLTGRSQALQEGLTERNQPINEISALLSGSQIALPQFQTARPGMPTTDYAGLMNQQ